MTSREWRHFFKDLGQLCGLPRGRWINVSVAWINECVRGMVLPPQLIMKFSLAQFFGLKEYAINMVQFWQWLGSEQFRMEQHEEDLQWKTSVLQRKSRRLERRLKWYMSQAPCDVFQLGWMESYIRTLQSLRGGWTGAVATQSSIWDGQNRKWEPISSSPGGEIGGLGGTIEGAAIGIGGVALVYRVKC